MANAKGLGRGLSALLGDEALKPESSGSLYLPIEQVESCKTQPRKLFDEDGLSDLADSIRAHGIIQPLTVRRLASGYYQIIAGERRWRAARLAGLRQVPVIVMEADDRKAAELAMIENLQREDLNPMEEASGYRALMENYHMTQEEMAARVGKSRSAVANSLRLLGLTPSVRQMVEEGKLSSGHARALLPLSKTLQEKAAAA
ncbi:MAG: ParB/RepB/Spo0J family partition protein, partial [Ruthenibacterium sp.]